ncbi:hypothetical protein P8C59_009214 [Phyllachora maydis]|uniref:Uncharacterized protein n=1 Tax=Phyllachora maydis TaxID=1825666 RepID=A0AAD9ICP9_9PEZI|nr:hypothetical protein P8C59_009214 [Phyllachora maydis]
MDADNISNRASRTAIESLAPEDFETSSIRSAAPSYISEAPSYHSTMPTNDPSPAYFPPTPASSETPSPSPSAVLASVPPAARRTGAGSSSLSPSPSPTAGAAGPSVPATLPAPAYTSLPSPRRHGLPPVPTGPPRAPVVEPSLAAFRISSWSSLSANPTARQYHNVAHRRSTQASAASGLDWMKRAVLERIGEEEGAAGSGGGGGGGGGSSSSSSSSSVGACVVAGGGWGGGDGGIAGGSGGGGGGESQVRRPLEDPYLVGEEAAARARRERLARENGDAILIREDRRWDFLLAQMNDWEERQRSWTRFRRQVDSHAASRGRLARRLLSQITIQSTWHRGTGSGMEYTH